MERQQKQQLDELKAMLTFAESTSAGREDAKHFVSLDSEARENWYTTLRSTLLSTLDKVSQVNCENVGVEDRESLPFLTRVRLVYSLSKQCPLSDVRAWCSDLLVELQDHGLKVRTWRGPSAFVPLNENDGIGARREQSMVVPVNTENPETKTLFTETFTQSGRVDHLTQLMGFHPQYLSCFHRTHSFLMREEGPLPLYLRHYIAIIASCRHQCSYLVHLHTNEFLQNGGNPSWLESLDNVPPKLRNLQNINRLLAHRPWLITSSHVEMLRRSGRNSWSMSELMHAIVLLAHFHALSSAVFGCGINYEVDDHAGRFLQSDGESNSDSDSECYTSEEAAVDSLLERLKTLKEDDDDVTEEEGLQNFQKVESQSAELDAKPTTVVSHNVNHSCISALVEDADFSYEEIVKRQETGDIQTFRASDFSWEAHGFSIANRFYSDIGNHLDEKFNVAKEFTYYTVGEYKNVNTQAFRTGVWNYIHCLSGIMHDDYNYSQVNSLLELSLQSYVKLLACYPERVTKRDFDSVMKGFKYSEKIHVNIIVMEAKMQAELLYALRAVAQFMT